MEAAFDKGDLLTQDDENRCEDESESQQTPDVMRSMVEGSCVQWEADLKVFLLGVLKNRDLAEDAFQKMVIRAIESAQTARPATLLNPMLHRSIAANSTPFRHVCRA